MADKVPASDPTVIAPPDDEPRPLQWLARFELALAGVFLLTLFIGVLWQVLGRYAQDLSWVGAGEIARYSLVGLTFIMVGYLVGSKGHITVAVIDTIVRGRGVRIVRFVAAVLLTVICAALLYEAWALFNTGIGRTTTVLRLPMPYIFSLVVFAFLSATVRGIVEILRSTRRDVRPEPELEV